jgi:hypothetical protein
MQPLLQWTSYKCYILWEWVCSLWCPACNAHAPYRYLWPARLYDILPHYLINGMIFEKVLLNIKCGFLYNFCLNHLGTYERHMINNVCWSSLQKPFILVMFLNFLDTFSKHTQISNFIKIRPVGAESLHADGRTNMKLIVAFRNFPEPASRMTSDRAVWFVYPIRRNLLKLWLLQQQPMQHLLTTDASVQTIKYH